jgi:predicted HicB family RNase H-like nuclease
MKNVMKYKNYIARLDYDPSDKIFYGDVVGTRDDITFEGKSVDELEKSFHESIDDYLALCKEEGIKPDTQSSGTLTLRLPPDTHTKITVAAKSEGVSVNRWASNVFELFLSGVSSPQYVSVASSYSKNEATKRHTVKKSSSRRSSLRVA